MSGLSWGGQGWLLGLYGLLTQSYQPSLPTLDSRSDPGTFRGVFLAHFSLCPHPSMLGPTPSLTPPLGVSSLLTSHWCREGPKHHVSLSFSLENSCLSAPVRCLPVTAAEWVPLLSLADTTQCRPVSPEPSASPFQRWCLGWGP